MSVQSKNQAMKTIFESTLPIYLTLWLIPDVSHGFVAGSVPPQSDALWKRFRDLGVVVETQVRRVDGREVAVDKIIQLQMANRILDVTPPETIVLLTGDGSGYSDGRGLVKQLERARNHGWDIEVVS